MARIRSIKPEFSHSESMGRVSRDARLTFIQLWTMADDEGRLRGNSRMLASLLFPYDDDARELIDGWLAELERENCIQRYLVEGATYIQIRNWMIHQKIDKPSKSKIPPFDESSRILSSPREDSRSVVGGLDLDQGREGKGREKEASTTLEKKRASAPPPFDPLTVTGLDPSSWGMWIEHRSAIRKPIKPHSMRCTAEELAKLGDRQMAEVKRAIAGGWQGLHPERANGSQGPPNGLTKFDRVTAGLEKEDQGFG